MAPGGEMFRYPQHFGENVLLYGSHEWLPYSKNAVRTKSPNTNSSNSSNQRLRIFVKSANFPLPFLRKMCYNVDIS